MDVSRRLIACTLVAVALLGLVPLRALAQQQAVVEVMPPEAPPRAPPTSTTSARG